MSLCAKTAEMLRKLYYNSVKHIIVFANDTSGATAIEYGLIASLVSVAIITVLTSLGETLRNTFQNINDSILVDPNDV